MARGVATVDELAQKLDEDRSWRIIEMSALKTSLKTAERKSEASPMSFAYRRAYLALSYAHWEGFFKNSVSHYVDFLKRRRIPVKAAADGLATGHVSRLVKSIESGDSEASIELLRIIRGQSARVNRIRPEDIIKKSENLRHYTLESSCLKLGIETDQFVTRGEFIDRKLCDARNSVAHGKFMNFNGSEIIEVGDFVGRSMDILKTAFIDAAEKALESEVIRH